MQAEIATSLTDLNRQFYQTFALQFSATRHRLQPGVRRVLDNLPEMARLLDLGCGNGELALELQRRNYQGSYLGLDFSQELLAQGSTALAESKSGRFRFQHADLTAPGWEEGLESWHPDIILAFAVLHHIPDSRLRLQILHKVRALLPSDGQFIFSVWQFLNSPRLKERIQPWETAGLNPEQVEPGDYLLDWRAGGHALRYVHHFSQSELDALADATKFMISSTYLNDGENGKLGLYQVWTLC
jgi:SAM-dependent methyltransferase